MKTALMITFAIALAAVVFRVFCSPVDVPSPMVTTDASADLSEEVSFDAPDSADAGQSAD